MPTPSVYLATVKLAAKSGVPKDAVNNSFCFTTSDNTHTNRNAIKILLEAFYNSIATGALRAVGSYLSPSIDRVAVPQVSLYNITSHLSGSPHGSPEEIIPFISALPSAVGTALPSECAIALSMKHDYGTDVEFGSGTRPRARDRGRIFLGPVTTTAITVDATTFRSAINVTARVDITKAAGVLMTNIDPTWCIWSRKAALAKSVTGGWVDDALDSQRRRGEVASVRTTF